MMTVGMVGVSPKNNDAARPDEGGIVLVPVSGGGWLVKEHVSEMVRPNLLGAFTSKADLMSWLAESLD